MTTPDDAALARLCDPAVPADERLRLAETALREDPDRIAAARRAGVLTAAWPATEAARIIGGSELTLLAICMPEGAVSGVLERADEEDVERVVLAVRLAEAVSRFDPGAAERFEPLLRGILSDSRRAFPYVEHAHDSLGAYAQGFHRTVAAAVARGDAERHGRLLLGAVAASLRRGGEEPRLYGVFEDALRIGVPAARLAQALTDALADAAEAPEARLAARRALDVLDGLSRHPDGAPAGMADAMRLAFDRAFEHLERIARDPGSAPSLREGVLARLHRWAPEVHVRLQREGVLPSVPIPSRRAHRNWTPAGIEELARAVSCDEAEARLAAPQEDDVDRIVTALRIAPSFAAWLPGAHERLVPLFVALLPSRIPVPMKSGVRTLGDMALEQFPALFPPVDSQTPAMQEVLCAGLEAARAAGLAFERIEDWLPNLLTPRSLKRLGLGRDA